MSIAVYIARECSKHLPGTEAASSHLLNPIWYLNRASVYYITFPINNESVAHTRVGGNVLAATVDDNSRW